MISGKIVVGIILLIAVITGVYMFAVLGKTPVNTVRVIDNPNENSGTTRNIGGNVIEITSSGFSPKTLTIKKGETVTWINKDTESHWPASATHPTHTVYPGSDIKKCETAEESNIFDTCRGLNPGESYSFTFNEIGSWSYHDHIVANLFGKVIVE